MKKALIMIAVTVLFAAGASAQVAPPVSCYLGGALSMPSSADFNTELEAKREWDLHSK